jgi:hypothetical protein
MDEQPYDHPNDYSARTFVRGSLSVCAAKATSRCSPPGGMRPDDVGYVTLGDAQVERLQPAGPPTVC